MSNTDFRRIDPSYDRYMRRLEASRRRAREQRLGDRAGDCVGNCRGNMANLDCAGLAEEKRQTQEAWTRQKLASESYKRDPAERRPPPGYSNATDADLRKLGLIDANGRRLTTLGSESNFNAAVFRRDGTDEYVVGFKGTEFLSGKDWGANFGQEGGKDTAYYTRAGVIGRTVEYNHPGKVEFVGHSLGGGLASAAARSSGLRATTFNAAGLHPNTVPQTVGNPRIDAWYVKGEALNRIQGFASSRPPRVAGRLLGLNPPGSIVDAAWWGPGPVTRHLNYRLDASFKRRMETIEELQREKGCP